MRTYSIIKTEDLGKVKFREILENSPKTIRRSLDDTLFVIKYNAEPTFIKDGTVKPSQTLTHSEALELMSTAAWSEPEPVEE